MFCAVIVAAGSSRRAGFDKLAAPLCGQSVLKRSVAAFVAAGAQEIVVVCPEPRWEALRPDAGHAIRIHRVDGGAERQDSVLAGVRALSTACKWVAVHDGARPLISPADISACLRVAQECGAAACAHPIVDTLKRATAAGESCPEVVSRENLWGMETPQIFDVELLNAAYQVVQEKQLVVTDEVSALEAIDHPTRLVMGGPNLKITLPHDLAIAELIWKERMA